MRFSQWRHSCDIRQYVTSFYVTDGTSFSKWILIPKPDFFVCEVWSQITFSYLRHSVAEVVLNVTDVTSFGLISVELDCIQTLTWDEIQLVTSCVTYVVSNVTDVTSLRCSWEREQHRAARASPDHPQRRMQRAVRGHLRQGVAPHQRGHAVRWVPRGRPRCMSGNYTPTHQWGQSGSSTLGGPGYNLWQGVTPHQQGHAVRWVSRGRPRCLSGDDTPSGSGWEQYTGRIRLGAVHQEGQAGSTNT